MNLTLQIAKCIRFMDSLQWVDQTYVQKHKSEDPQTLRSMYYPNLRLYETHGDTSKHRAPMDAAVAFLLRFSRRAAMSLAVFALSYLPVVGRFVLPAASFYTFNKSVGPVPATFIFGLGLFLPRRYLVVFLQSYFSSRSLMRELVSYGAFCSALLHLLPCLLRILQVSSMFVQLFYDQHTFSYHENWSLTIPIPLMSNFVHCKVIADMCSSLSLTFLV